MTNEITTTEEQTPKRRSIWRSIGILLSTLGIIIVIAAFGYGYFRLAGVNISLAKMISTVRDQTVENKTQLEKLQQSVGDLQQSAQKSQELSQQQAQLVAEWRSAQKGNLDKWYVAEAASLVKLANDQAQFSQNTAMALMLLQKADQVLQNVQAPDLLPIRQSLSQDMAKVQALPKVDITNLYVRLMSLDGQLGQLPLPFNPMKNDNTQTSPPAALPPGTSWWRAGLAHSWQSLKELVIVRNIQASQPPLVLPEQKVFIYQNLHTQLQNAVWGALHRNAVVYQLSLAQLLKWIPQYFLQDAPATKAVLQEINELIKMDVQAPAIQFSDTIKLFDQYLAQPQQTSTENASPEAPKGQSSQTAQ